MKCLGRFARRSRGTIYPKQGLKMEVSFLCLLPIPYFCKNKIILIIMYTIISGTNRLGSHTEKVALIYQHILKQKNIDAKIFSLKGLILPTDREILLQKEREIFVPTDKFIFIIPEYNGSYPGVLKMMIDYTDTNTWHFKKALLTGVSTGRAGNLRGMDHLADTLHYLKMTVHYNKLPISSISRIMNAEGMLDNDTLKVIHKQLDEFILY